MQPRPLVAPNSACFEDILRQSMQDETDPMPKILDSWEEEDHKWLENSLHFWRGIYLKEVMKSNGQAKIISDIMENLRESYGKRTNKRSKRTGFRIKWAGNRA